MIGSMRLPGGRLGQLGAGFAALLTGAAIFGWLTGETPPSAGAPGAAAAWVLPQTAVRDPAADAALLRKRHPWGGGGAFQDVDAAPPAPTAAASAWQLAGVVERGDARYALILIGRGAAAQLEYRTVGDSLPDGSVLVQIDADSATSEGGQSAAAERRVYRLFEKAH